MCPILYIQTKKEKKKDITPSKNINTLNRTAIQLRSINKLSPMFDMYKERLI